MQDRYYVIGIIVILAICCLGGYVAISGYMNSNPSSFALLTPGAAASPIIVQVPTDTPGPTKPPATPVGAPTSAPVPSPLGAFQTIAASTTQLPPPPTASKPQSNPPTAQPTAAAQSCGGFAFCYKGGPPDYTLGPTSNCPPNYIWGRVVDKNGNGLPNIRIRHKLLSTGDVSDVFTKAPPDPAGAYNIPTGQPGSTWLVWIVDSGNQASPQVNIMTQPYPGAGNCPTRIDFVQQ